MKYEVTFKEGFNSYIRVFNEKTGKSECIDIPNKYEYYVPSSNGDYSYIYDKTLRLEKRLGSSKDANGQYGIFNPIDHYVRDHFWKTGYNIKPHIWYLDIETRSGQNSKGFPKPENALEEICLIQIYDTVTETMYVLGTRDFKERPDYKVEYKLKYLNCKDEVELINTFLTIFKKLDPLIVYAWNGDNFDFPYLFNRLKNLDIQTDKLSNYGSVKLTQGMNFNQVTFDFSSHGHYFLDLLKVYKKFAFRQLPSYSLDDVSKAELNDNKIEHDEFLDFDSFYTGKNYQISDTPYKDTIREQIRQAKIKGEPCEDLLQFRFVWYGIQDVYLMKRIDDKINLTSILISIAQEMGCTFDEALRTVRPWSIGLQNLFYENKLICPVRKENDNPNVVGGYVRDPVVGIHEWLLNFDVNSEYPMLSIVAHNMSPEMIIPTHKLPSDLREHVIKYFNNQDESKLLNYPKEVWDNTKQLLKKYNVSLTINGTVLSHEATGIIPQKVSEIYYGRKKDKKTMIAYENQIEVINDILNKKSFSDKTIDTIKDALEYTKDELLTFSKETLLSIKNFAKFKANMYHALQMTKKILINSLYGALSNKGFILFNEKIAQSITGNGRFFIRYTANNIEDKLQSIKPSKEKYILYGDTDSVYYHIGPIMHDIMEKQPNKSISEYVDIASKFEEKIVDPIIQQSIKEFSELFNAYNPDAIGAKREIIADKCLFVAKKKYVARVRDAEGIRYPENDPHMKVMGLDLARSATPDWCRKKLEESLNIILEKSENELKEWINKNKPDFCKQPVKDIAMYGSVSRTDYSLNDKGIPFMCKAGIYYNMYIERNNLQDKYMLIEPDSSVKLMRLLSPNPFGTDLIAYNSDNFEHEFKDYIDYDTQFKKSFMDPLNNMVKNLGYDIYSDNEELEDW